MEIEVAGPGTFAVEVVGESRYQHVLEAALAESGAVVEAVLVRDDANVHDDQAVAVTIGGQICGYLRRDAARAYRADLAAAGAADATVRCAARITGGFVTKDGGRAHYGLVLDLPALSG